jgi:hypothetical protein
LEKGDNSSGVGSIFYEDIIGKVKYIITKDGFKKSPPFIRGKNILFFILDFFIVTYIKLAYFLKNRLFLRKNNGFFRGFGTIVWRIYYFYFKLIIKNRKFLFS